MTFTRWQMLWIAVITLSAAPISSADSTLGNTKFSEAMDLVASGELDKAKRASVLLAEAKAADPTEPLFPRIDEELKILFRADYGITAATEATKKAQFQANQKKRSMRMALEPSKLSGKNNPEMAERFRLEAEQILSDAALGEERAGLNLALALERTNNFGLELMNKGEPTIAAAVIMAGKAIQRKNSKRLEGVDPPFSPPLSAIDLEDMRVRAKINHEIVAVGFLREKEGKIEEAIDLFKRAGYEKGVKRLSGE